MKTTGRGTPAVRKRSAIWGGGGGRVYQVGQDVVGNKRRLDDGMRENGGDEESGGGEEG